MNESGNLRGKQPRPAKLVAPEIQDTDAPDWFNPFARWAFDELKPLVVDRCKAEDVPAFHNLCLSYGRIKEAEVSIVTTGLLVENHKGQFVNNPVWAIQKEAMQMFNALCVKFALSPVDRARLQNETNAQLVNDPMAELLMKNAKR
jgi:P27 family predicted phage terminase small subunit